MLRLGVINFIVFIVNGSAKPHNRCVLKYDSILNNEKDILALVQKMQHDMATTHREMKSTIDLIEHRQDRMQNKLWDIEKTLTRIPGMVSPIFERIGMGLFYIENRVKQNWTDAQYTCRLSGGHLAVFQTKEEFENVAWKLVPSNEYWLGINDRAKWSDYIAEASEKRVPFIRWTQEEPENLQEIKKNCVGMTERKVADWPCDSKLNFICQSDYKY